MPNEIVGVNSGGAGYPVEGSFQLVFGGQTTGTLNWDDSNETVQAALEALSSIGVGNILVTGSGVTIGISLEFVGVLADTDVGAVTVASDTCKAAAVGSISANRTTGSAHVDGIWTITNNGFPSSGTWSLNGNTMAYDCSEWDVQAVTGGSVYKNNNMDFVITFTDQSGSVSASDIDTGVTPTATNTQSYNAGAPSYWDFTFPIADSGTWTLNGATMSWPVSGSEIESQFALQFSLTVVYSGTRATTVDNVASSSDLTLDATNLRTNAPRSIEVQQEGSAPPAASGGDGMCLLGAG